MGLKTLTYQPASQPASQPTSQPTNQSTNYCQNESAFNGTRNEAADRAQNVETGRTFLPAGCGQTTGNPLRVNS